MNGQEKINDLHDLVNHPDVTVSFTKSKSENSEDAKLRRFKDKWLFAMTLLVVFGIVITCTTFIFISGNSQHIGIALNGVIGIGLALAGYYARGKSH